MRPIMLGAALIFMCAGADAADLANDVGQSFKAFALGAPAGTYAGANFNSSNGQDLPYRLLMPLEYDQQYQYPLVVWLHGSGEMGTNGNPLGNGTEIFVLPVNLQKYRAIILVPQCPRNDRWSTMSSADAPGRVRMAKAPTRTAASVFELVAQVKAQLSVEPKHVAVVGLSLGGFGVYDFLLRRPDLFTMGLPMSGGGDAALAARLKATPLWDFHGDHDEVVGVAHSRAMISAIRAAGGKPRYTEIPVGQHGPWTPIINESEVLDWLLTL